MSKLGIALVALLLWAPPALSYQSPLTEPLTGGRHGGVLKVLDEAAFESLDPGQTFYSLDYEVVYATQRPLFSFRPNSLEPVPDLAAGPAVISPDAKTVTVRLRRGVRFGPPVDREVSSRDVAYAIERGANPHVANPYIHAYFESVEGMPDAEGGPIRGIRTPNAHEIVFKLTRPLGQLVVDALSLPLSAPVPKGYAQRFDRRRPSDYVDHEVATGPYMIANDRSGKVLGVGYRPFSSLTLVRNPNWRRSTDFRPAYLRKIEIRIGGTLGRIGRTVLNGGAIVENEPPAESVVYEAAEKHPAQLEISPGAGDHYVGVNNARGPFKDVNLRKALWAALDRQRMNLVRGGTLLTSTAGHFLYPTIPGFEQAGGLEGPKGASFDFDEHPQGDLEVAEKYLRLAGYPGRYTGSEVVSIVGARGEPAEADAKIVEETVKRLGFKTDLKLVETATMYARYCNVPKEEPDICPSVGWIADIGEDPQTALDLTFNGRFIDQTGNVNWSQTNVPAINAAMEQAETIVGIAARASAWARIDDELVEDATAIPFDWDSQANIEGRRVRGVGDLWNVGAWDYSFTSLR